MIFKSLKSLIRRYPVAVVLNFTGLVAAFIAFALIFLQADYELSFEMMYSLIDVENNAIGMTQRKGIADELERAIKKTFYKDEEDATQYYLDKMKRKKEHGGKYNEKFLEFGNQRLIDDIGEESEEVE